MPQHLSATLVTGVLALTLTACGTVGSSSGGGDPAGAEGSSGEYVNVVKLTGIAWFDRMETGVDAFTEQTGLAASQTGPATADTELQVGVIQGLIAQRPEALGVVPLDPGAVENVIQQAKDAGIVVVTHEAPTIQNADADIEAFDNADYGTKIMAGLAECMGGEGEYVQFVGSLTSETHMAWAEAGLAAQQAEHPGMTRVSDPVESDDNADTAYEKTKQLLQANPALRGFFGDSSQDVPGIGRAIAEAGLQDDTCVYGTGVPSETRELVADGSVDGIYLWDPALAGQAVLSAAQIIAEGGELSTGTDLGVEGYGSLVQSPDNPKTFLGDAALALTAETIDDYDF
ncbi:MAG: ABC transporter, substrate-binding protein (cluster 2, ribose/xylose/arabinose/galactose) [uncultured Quadrisphaera sp.]|uniref:ABC transporter, substrate-binding protein (Cluster 2, ribose/xylose/arabinose/galactose) n=1 Tax=uncultured Quadrisphaera sp. TaxID=904978 RepID=A0A6J4PQT4_9ACTN|nr:MAG: ABC transporter, substrate-binding protein (cluster 2, ribose/xylose/arabinose/galactose) [uncultured Quadrisphaera sp.]